MDGWRATPRNNLLGAASDGLRSVRGALDVVPLPEVLGGGLGQLLIGKAPEEVNEWSYGNSPLRETPQGPRLLPQFRSDRGAGVVDTALLPVAETLGLAKLGNYGLRKMGEAVGRRLDTPAEAGRREFLQQTGALTGAAAAGAAVPPMVKGVAKLMDAPVEEGLRRGAVGAAARAVARATPAEFYTAYRALLGNADAARRAVSEAGKAERDELYQAAYDAFMKSPEGRAYRKAARRADETGEFVPDWTDEAPLQYTAKYFEKQKALTEASSKAWDDVYNKGIGGLRKDQRYEGYKTPDEIDDMFTRGGSDAGFAELRRIGVLPNDEVETLLKEGRKYVDPQTGNSAHLDRNGQLVWRNASGDEARYQHWLPSGSERHYRPLSYRLSGAFL